MRKHNLHQSGEKGENLSLQETIRATVLAGCNLYKQELGPKNPNFTQSNNMEYQNSCHTKSCYSIRSPTTLDGII